MITTSDSPFTIHTDDRFIILPSDGIILDKYLGENKKFDRVEQNFSYNSATNNRFLNVEQLRELIKKNIDKNFYPI